MVSVGPSAAMAISCGLAAGEPWPEGYGAFLGRLGIPHAKRSMGNQIRKLLSGREADKHIFPAAAFNQHTGSDSARSALL